jgi:hypothetical protein
LIRESLDLTNRKSREREALPALLQYIGTYMDTWRTQDRDGHRSMRLAGGVRSRSRRCVHVYVPTTMLRSCRRTFEQSTVTRLRLSRTRLPVPRTRAPPPPRPDRNTRTVRAHSPLHTHTHTHTRTHTHTHTPIKPVTRAWASAGPCHAPAVQVGTRWSAERLR